MTEDIHLFGGRVVADQEENFECLNTVSVAEVRLLIGRFMQFLVDTLMKLINFCCRRGWVTRGFEGHTALPDLP